MGRLIYHRANVFEVDDRLLSHLELVTNTKLRRGEAFLATFNVGPADGSGRITVWVNRASNLVFKYRHERPRINPEWLDVLMTAANSPAGLTLLPEPVQEASSSPKSA